MASYWVGEIGVQRARRVMLSCPRERSGINQAHTLCLKKGSPTLSIVTWCGIIRFYNNFWYEYSWHNWPANDRPSCTSPNVCFYTTWGKQNKQSMRWNNQKNVENIPDIDCNLKKDYHILIAFARYILTQLAIKWPFEFSPHLTSASALPAKNRTDEKKYALKWTKKCYKIHLSRSVASNSRDLSPFDYNVSSVMQHRVYQMSFRNVELKKWLVEVWSRTSSTLLSTSACLGSHKGPIFQTFTVSSRTIRQLDKLSAKVTGIWTKMCFMCVLLIK